MWKYWKSVLGNLFGIYFSIDKKSISILDSQLDKFRWFCQIVFSTCSRASCSMCSRVSCASFATCFHSSSASWLIYCRANRLSCPTCSCVLCALYPMCSRALRAPSPTCSRFSLALCLAHSCLLRAPFPLFFGSHRISCLACLEPYVSSKFMNTFYLRTLSASYL